jgi:LysM repeat protein
MDVDSSSKSGISSMMPLAIGILGVLVGGVALIMSFNDSSKIAALRSDLNDTTQAASTAKTEADQAAGLSAKLDATSSKLDAFMAQASSVLDQFKQAITDDRTKIVELSDTVGKLHGSGASTAKGGEPTSHVVPGQGGTYAIAAGDNLSIVAKKFGVSLSALEAANPGVDSSKLKIGQVITIPGGKSSAPTPRAAAPADTAAGSPASAVSTS